MRNGKWELNEKMSLTPYQQASKREFPSVPLDGRYLNQELKDGTDTSFVTKNWGAGGRGALNQDLVYIF